MDFVRFLSELESPKSYDNNKSYWYFVKKEIGWNHLVESFNDNLSKNVDKLPIISLRCESLVKEDEVVVEIVTPNFLFVEEQETNSKERKSKDPEDHEGDAKSQTPD